jgi:GntR family phosphonate transport system transcriptional regulator
MDELPMTGRAPLDHAGGIALWRQIVHAIEQDVTDGTLAPGARLPTEAEMSAHFGVNRHTVRHALEELARAGMVQVEQGRGSFVAEDVLDYAISARTRFSEWIRAHNKEPGGRMLDLRELAADAATAAGLGLAAGAPVVRMQRLGLADGRPVSLADHHFSAARSPGLLAALRDHQTVTAALAAVGVRDYRRQQTRVSARMPQGNEAELLRMPRNRPLLITESVNVDAAGAVVEFGVTRYPTPRVQIVFES